MAEQITRLRSMGTFVLSLLFLGNLFLKSELVYELCFLLMVAVIVLSLPAVTGVSRVIGFASLGLSVLLLLIYRAPLSVWRQALMGNLYLVALFTMVPILSIPIQHGGYYSALENFFRSHVHSTSRYYVLVSFISAFVGVLVNLAVVPLVYEIVQASELSRNKRLMSSAISRGFTTCMIWAPTTAAVALVLQLSGASWGRFFPLGILCGVICGIIGYIMTMIQERGGFGALGLGGGNEEIERHTERNTEDHSNVISKDDSQNPSSETAKLHKIVELAAFSVILMVSIAVISVVTGIQTVIIVSLAALIFPFLWMGMIGRLSVLTKVIKTYYFKDRLTKLSSEIVLFVGAGMLAESIAYSNLGHYIPMVLSKLVGESAFLLSVVVIFGSVILSAMGVHPIIHITIIGASLQASAFGVSPTYIALLLGVSWSMGITLAPTSPTVITLSGLASRSPVQVGLKWNGLYVLISSCVLIVFLTGLRMAGWL
ncbi:MAG: C4-dicarboxylate ABC transporter [Acidaminobacter sp.]|uniref:C4-dicarboxylate ABC transporter n=1 Tax=Acidaminobacter sp. TaxID=1872102 RepID=UPI00137F9FF8|nr:C4-dicarboxylate ABC transporter [Acidaminobacter sp.]MZQ97035.1 C4-dicarboxylate ABC transporter [Acidaminobacter sp.]